MIPTVKDDLERTRSFSLLDAMILIAATAIGLAIIRIWTGPGNPFAISPNFNGFPRYYAYRRIFSAIVCSIGLWWSIAVLVMRSRDQWRSIRSWGRQAGVVACFAAVLGSLTRIKDRDVEFTQILINLSTVQIVFAMSSCWKPSVDWIDRLGRCMGWFWVTMYVESILII